MTVHSGQWQTHSRRTDFSLIIVSSAVEVSTPASYFAISKLMRTLLLYYYVSLDDVLNHFFHFAKVTERLEERCPELFDAVFTLRGQ